MASTGLKMAASAAVAAALTAALFLTLWDGPAVRSAPPAEERGAAAPADPITPSGVAANDAAEALDTRPVPRELPRIEGNGVVRGRVMTAEGQDLDGVVIIATPRPEFAGPLSGGAPPTLDLKQEIETIRRRVTGTRRATTTDGHYLLSGLGNVGYSIRAYAMGYAFQPVEGHSSWDVKPGATVDFVARAIVGVHVHVEGIEGGDLGRVSILCAPDEEFLKRAGGSSWSPGRPVLRLAPGTWWLQAVQGNDRERLSEAQKITVEVGAPIPTVVLQLRDRPGLCGSIVVFDDLDAYGVDVRALRFEGAEPPKVEGFWRNREALRGRYNRSAKRYSFRDIRPGRYFLWVTLASDRVMGSAVVEIQDRIVEQDIRVGIDDPDRYVVVRVIGPDGKPLDARRTQITTSYESPRMRSSGGGGAIHRNDGSWLVEPYASVPSPAEEPGGTYRVRVTHPSLGSQEIAYDPTSQRELDFRFGMAASLVVTISGLERAGLIGRVSLRLKKSLERYAMTSRSERQAKSSGDVFTFDKIQPGEWLLVLALRGVGILNIVDRMSIAVGDGENRIDWALPRLYTVRLELAKKAKPVRFGLAPLDPAWKWMHQFASSPEGGDVVFEFVPAGRYELVGAYDGKTRRMVIDVPGQTHIRLE